MDKHFVLGAQDSATGYTGSPTIHAINKYKKLPVGSFTIFDGTGGGIADINTGALYLVTIGDQSAASVAGGTARLACRVRYTDS